MPSCTSCGSVNRAGARFCDTCGASLEAPDADASEARLGAVAGGRYELVRLLGEGGKKRVYLGHDSLLDREVAVSLIKADDLDEPARARVLREAQAMGKLGAHPHIVTVFDLGDENGRPYLVTELMAGGDLECLCGPPGERAPVSQVLELGKGICRGLAFAHEQGLVHRDLKPGNVWLTEDGRPKIGDFGLALSLERSRLTQEGTIVGTTSYLPPEQALGGEVTPRSDLYSLGALLYELVTGRPPFLGDDPVSIISQHINTPPVAPTWHAPECPRALDALIVRLLAKDPSERPESATDVLAALEAVDPAEAPAPAERASGETHALEGLAGGVFVGRQQELGQLKAALERALSNEGRMVTLVGEPGIGKSRTALELATYARLRGADVLWGRCYESEGAPPYWPWVQALRPYVRECDPVQLRSELGTGAPEIAEVVTDVALRLPDLVAPPPMEDASQARFRLFDSLTAFLRSASASKPLVLVLDDLHWADAGSLLLLEFVARELTSARLLLIGTYRDVELSRRHPLWQTLAELTRERLFERVVLRGLSRDDVGRFIEATSGVSPPDELVAAVHTQTEGNPLFVTEVVRLLVQENELTQGRPDPRETWSVRIPEGVREVIGRRLDRLSERCNDTLIVASVIGREFGIDVVRRLVDDLSQERLLEALDEALSARVIEELPQALGRYQFTHALIRDTLEEELSLTRRVRLHARIAEALEDVYGEDAVTHAAELAHHFGEAEALLGPDKLVHYTLIAGEASLAAHAYEQALVQFQRALAAKGDQKMDDEAAALLFGRSRAELATLPPREWEPTVRGMARAFEYYVEAGDPGRAVAVAAHPFPDAFGIGQTKMPELIGRALTLVLPDSLEAGRLLSTHGWLSGVIQGDYDAAQEAFASALGIAERQSDAALQRRTLARAAFVDAFHLRWPECRARGLQAVELSQLAEDLPPEVTANRVVAWAYTVVGERGQARAHAAAAFASAEKLREHWSLASTSYHNALLSQYEGDWRGAREMGDIGLAAQPWDPRHLGLRAVLEYEVGESAAGAATIAQLEEVARSVAASPGPAADQVFLAAVSPLVAYIADADDQQVASSTAAAVDALSVPQLPRGLAMGVEVGQALAAVRLGDAESAARLYRALEPWRGTAVWLFPFAVDRLLGLLASTCDDPDAASAHFEDGLAFCARSGYRAQYAWTASDYAEALLSHRPDDGRKRAVSLQDEALAIARELEMRALMERVLARREVLEA